ncbi:MAG: DUF1801 domain-containing protein [Flavobacteriales bacterium]
MAPRREPTAEEQLDTFLAKYTPAIAAQARTARRMMQARFPHAIEMVYDNYNALVIGYCPTERPSEAIFSLAMLPKYISLCFLHNAGKLPDPHKLLQGTGNTARHIKLKAPADLDLPAVNALIKEAEKSAVMPFDKTMKGVLVIRSISAKQRPRRPA